MIVREIGHPVAWLITKGPRAINSLMLKKFRFQAGCLSSSRIGTDLTARSGKGTKRAASCGAGTARLAAALQIAAAKRDTT